MISLMSKRRRIFFVIATGGKDTDRHYRDTIEQKRNLLELGPFLTGQERNILEHNYHGGPFAIWGAVPGSSNISNWNRMEPGDYAIVYRGGKIIFAAEIALKIHNKDLARHFWQTTKEGETWEYVYFMVNAESVSVDISKLSTLVGYKANYVPQKFMAIDQEKADALLSTYGDILSVLKQLEVGRELEKIDVEKKEQGIELVSEKIERAPTEHDEMQWRLIRLGLRARVDVWVPRNDQGKSYEGNNFREHVLEEFQSSLDVPKYVENIDVVWKYGYSIKSAFEVEHSTSVYSGILRLSDLRALTPNSIYPLFIVADRERKNKVFSELKRPTFDNPYLRLKEVIGFLSYDKVRELDEGGTSNDANLTTDFLLEQSERVT